MSSEQSGFLGNTNPQCEGSYVYFMPALGTVQHVLLAWRAGPELKLKMVQTL